MAAKLMPVMAALQDWLRVGKKFSHYFTVNVHRVYPDQWPLCKTRKYLLKYFLFLLIDIFKDFVDQACSLFVLPAASCHLFDSNYSRIPLSGTAGSETFQATGLETQRSKIQTLTVWCCVAQWGGVA
jgi:hypothetical protein